MDYQTSISMQSYPTRAYVNQIKNNSLLLKHFENNQTAITYENLKERMLVLNVYYASMNYVHFYEIPETEMGDLVSENKE